MCGILGICSEALLNKEEICNLLSSLKHRGPDSNGTWVSSDSKISLAHTRLAIIDITSCGHQPMISFSGRYVITFNGEIYNYKEIKKELEINKSFKIKWKSNTDTEVLLEAIEFFGLEETLNKCEGMFAFGLYDNKNKNLFLARDRFGEKPLYFGWVKNNFIFCSDLSILKKYPHFDSNDINKKSVSLLLDCSYIPTPYSIFNNFYKLFQGTILTIDCKQLPSPINEEELNDGISLKNFTIKKWIKEENIDYEKDYIIKDEADLEYYANNLENLLENSVKLQMVSDVPLGAFLSGGIDSSLIVALMQKNSQKKIETFSFRSSDSRYDESFFARRISKILSTSHNELFVTNKDLKDIVPNLASVFSEPFADSSQIPSLIVSKFARKKVTVALTGDGGDELFGGYNRYIYIENIWKIIGLFPYYLRKKFSEILLNINVSSYQKYFLFLNKIIKLDHANLNEKFFKLLEKIKYSKNKDEFFLSFLHEWRNISDILNFNQKNDFLYKEYSKIPTKIKGLKRMIEFDKKFYLSDDILCKVDRSSMYHSLETRAPYLNKDVHNFSRRIPDNFLINKQKGKIILRSILKKYIPEDLINRPKMGFSIPLDEFLRSSLKQWAEDIIHSDFTKNNQIINYKSLKFMWDEHIALKKDWHRKIWPILIFLSWQQSGR